MGIVGTVYGVTKGHTVANFTTVVNEIPASDAIFKAVCATVFAYEGWIIATSINAEIKDAKKNLPRALVLGAIIIVAIYILYYVGLAGAIPYAEMMKDGQAGAKTAFATVFGKFMGNGIFVFVIISCLGTLNGLMLGCTRGLYSISSRGRGPAPRIFANVDKDTNMPGNSSIFGLLLCAAWLLYFYFVLTGKREDGTHILGFFMFDPTEIPIVTIYPFYIPIFIKMMADKNFKGFNRFVAPVLAVFGSAFMVFAAIRAHGPTIPGYLIIFAIVMIIGVIFMKKKNLSSLPKK
jgi:APA family basic amino acid/polyamine antiporter